MYTDTTLRLYAGERGVIPAVVFSQEPDVEIKTQFVILQEAIVRLKTCQILNLTEESGIVQHLDARKIQENRGKKREMM